MSDDILRELVEGERAALDPAETPDDAKQATWNRVAHSVAIGAPVAGFGAGKVVAAKAGLSYGKGLAALVFAGAAAVGAYELASDRDDPSVASAPVTATSPAASGREGESTPARRGASSVRDDEDEGDAAVEVPAPVVVPPVTPPPRAATARPAPRATGRRPEPEPTPPPADAASALAEEARLLADARRKLQAGQARAALIVLDDHAERFAHGQLREDRMALRARALCRAGDLEAGRREGAALRKAFPSSSHLDRTAQACGDATP